MKKAVKIFNILSICCISFSAVNVDATSGRLKGNSIKTCNGTTYGYHSDHWHKAVDRGDAGYYPDGAAIYSDPCVSNNTPSQQPKPSTSTQSNQQPSSSTTTQKTQPEPSKQETIKQETPKQETQKQESTSANKDTSKTNTPTSSKNNSTTTQNREETKEEVKKNTDNTLSSVVVDDEKIEVSKKMEFKTTKESVKISIKTTDSNATYKVIGDKELVVGLNEYIIEVKAEDGSKKEYELNITREKELSSNKNIKVTVNNTELIFSNKLATTSVSNSVEKAYINYTLEDKNSKATIKGPEKLKVGDNEFKITVTAEDKSTTEYTVIVNRSTKTSDAVGGILGFGLLGGMGYGIYWCYKRTKNVFKKVFK